jgi:hypothetical protein
LRDVRREVLERQGSVRLCLGNYGGGCGCKLAERIGVEGRVLEYGRVRMPHIKDCGVLDNYGAKPKQEAQEVPKSNIASPDVLGLPSG